MLERDWSVSAFTKRGGSGILEAGASIGYGVEHGGPKSQSESKWCMRSHEVFLGWSSAHSHVYTSTMFEGGKWERGSEKLITVMRVEKGP